MAEPARRLAARLRELRLERFAAPLTQAQVAAALGASIPLVSSWENANAVPPEERLKSYALLFAPEAISPDDDLRLRDEAELSETEREERRRLVDELVALRDKAQPGVGRETSGPLGGGFWYFPEATRIRIITTRLWPQALEGVAYANPWHPNYLETLWDGDRDASIELFGHIRAENPSVDVRLLTSDRVTRDDLTGHVILLGQADNLLTSGSVAPRARRQSVLEYLARRLELPFGRRVREGGDPEFDGEFVVTVDGKGDPRYYRVGEEPAGLEVYRPVFLRDDDVEGRPRRLVDGYPQLEYDVALLARKPNQLNLATSVTICSGVFSRGTYGAVRALTDANLRGRNEEYLRDKFDVDDFWLLMQVPVFSGESGADTLTPDLSRPHHRLRRSE